MAEMISSYNLLLRERDRLREALTRLHAWALEQEGDCIFSAGHPVARAAAALYGNDAETDAEKPNEKPLESTA